VNNSKKLQTKNVKKDRLVEPKPITKISLPWIIVSAVLLVILIGALLVDQLYKPTILKVDGKNYTMNDLSYYFYSVESKYQYYDTVFGGNGAYWDMVVDQSKGTTVRDSAKQEAIQSALYNEVTYNQAVKDGYTLTDEEKKTVSTNVDALLNSQITPADIRKNHFTKAYLTKVLNKATLADRYRKDKITALNIDKEAIKKGITYEDYRQYNIQYLFISTQKTDDKGNTVDMTADEKTAAYDKINAAFAKVKTTEDWSTLIPKDETQLTYNGNANFTKTGTTYSEDMKKMMMAMNNGDISNIYVDPKGYYIIRMVNNNSSESYDNAVNDAITKAEDDAFSNVFTKDILPKHPYTVNDKELAKFRMGTITLSE
jgi:foldase protein PrsA